jgi:hypothetical protein
MGSWLVGDVVRARSSGPSGFDRVANCFDTANREVCRWDPVHRGW